MSILSSVPSKSKYFALPDPPKVAPSTVPVNEFAATSVARLFTVVPLPE